MESLPLFETLQPCQIAEKGDLVFPEVSEVTKDRSPISFLSLPGDVAAEIDTPYLYIR